MTDNDPFSDSSDRTIIKPSAGRGPRPAAAPDAVLPTAPLPELPGPAGLNPLLAAASPLLGAAARIRDMAHCADPAALRQALADGVRRFEQQARAAGLPNEQVIGARYTLCTFLDEAASSTPWGGSGVWGRHSLLVQFHNEAFGGEKVFVLMGKLAENVAANRSLLELMYAALALGFEGRYRVLDNGRAQLDSVRERLAQMLRQEGDAAALAELSPAWAGERARSARLSAGVPVWVVASAAALLLALLFGALRWSAGARSEPVYGALAALDVKAAPPPPPPQPAAKPRLAGLLAPDIQAQLIEVRDLADRSVVVIRGDGFFERGSAEVSDSVKPLLGRIATALHSLPGPVLVTGHTDNQPIKSLRYPSNWHLSQDRANSVKALLAVQVAAERLRADGRGDTEPLGDNASEDGRRKNRRVEITLAVPPGA